MNLKDYRILLTTGMALGFILIIDQLYLFGIPFGGFLGDLSGYDITGSPAIHHWMLGLVLLTVCAILYRKALRSK